MRRGQRGIGRLRDVLEEALGAELGAQRLVPRVQVAGAGGVIDST